MPRYNPAAIEPKWQAYWEHHQTFKTPDLPPAGQPKLYVLDMFPYPSGSGLHVGHPEGYTATDIVCRFARMNGKCVLHPMGFDAFGLPAEEHAKATGTHPRTNTEKNIKEYKDKLDASDVSKLESEVESVKAALKGNNAADMKAATEKLNAVWHDVAQRMYQQASASESQAGAQSQAKEQSNGDGGPDGVADAEFEVIDDEKKKG